MIKNERSFVGVMLKKLAKCVREYKRETILTLCLMVGEAIIETLIPFITATFLINQIQEKLKKYKCWIWKDTMCASTLRALVNLEIKNKIQTKKIIGLFFI